MTESKKGQNRVIVYPDWCKGCGICVAFCPKQVLALGSDGKARVVAEEACINCGFCEPHCPDFAIMVVPPNGNGRCGPKSTGPAEPPSKPPPDGPSDAAPESASETAPEPFPRPGGTPTGDKEGRP
jgi:2-oxoglutarate ferredoxin oxidoreductase subunit delta